MLRYLWLQENGGIAENNKNAVKNILVLKVLHGRWGKRRLIKGVLKDDRIIGETCLKCQGLTLDWDLLGRLRHKRRENLKKTSTLNLAISCGRCAAKQPIIFPFASLLRKFNRIKMFTIADIF